MKPKDEFILLQNMKRFNPFMFTRTPKTDLPIHTQTTRYKYQQQARLKKHEQKGNEVVANYFSPSMELWVIDYRYHVIDIDKEPVKYRDSKTLRDTLEEHY